LLSCIIDRMDELDEIREKEEELYDDLIEPEEKRITRHPLFLFLAILALISVLFFAVNYFVTNYFPWREEKSRNHNRSSISMTFIKE
jgi:hypothetical protein